MKHRALLLPAILATALIATAGSAPRTAHAIDEAPAWAYAAMAHDLMSPYCPGRTLAECPSPQATELRFWILTQAAAGVSEADVRGMLEERFGDVLLSAPRAEGWGFSAYAIPIVFFILGGPVVLLVLRRMSGGGASLTSAPVSAPKAAPGTSALPADGDSGTPSVGDEELEEQLERELGEL